MKNYIELSPNTSLFWSTENETAIYVHHSPCIISHTLLRKIYFNHVKDRNTTAEYLLFIPS